MKRKIEHRWPGYTLDELRLQRALVQGRIMVERYNLSNGVGRIRDGVNEMRSPTSVAGRILGALGYMDWIVLGLSAMRKFGVLFKKRK